MKKIFIVSIFCATISMTAAESKVITAEDTASVNGDMQSVQVITSGTMMENVFEKYREERNLPAYGEPNAKGTTYFTGQATVAANVASPDFIKSRSAAYAKAYMDAIAKLVLDRFGRELTKTLRSSSANNSTDATKAPENLEAARSTLESKAAALEEAKIDQELESLGVNPAAYADKSIAAKRDLYVDSIVTQVSRKAFGSAAGCLPVQTFETRTGDGHYTIGVVLRSDAVCSEVARCISVKQYPTLRGNSGLSVKDALPTDEEMLTQFGIRLYFDETGAPSLLSFAQYGSSYTGKESRQMDRALQSASRQAENISNQQLTDFINSTIKINETSFIGEEEVSKIIFRKDGSSVKEDMVKIIDKWSSSSTSVGFDSMIGRSTVYRKILRHPSGHPIAVVVRRWSFSRLEAEQAVISGKTPESKTSGGRSVKAEGSGIRRGKTYDF